MTKARRPIELLAPAKNLECGMAAIDHGADAVYIGADSFGARVSAGNTTDSIAELCHYAHVFGAKVYVTVNTIIFENELAKADRLIGELVKIGVDAILVQDMAVLELIKKYGNDVPELHASTQTDNRNTEKVKWLHSVGFKRVVLARELSLKEIKHIHAAAPDVELEAFVHGALCVSYSGACYASLHCFNRSANLLQAIGQKPVLSRLLQCLLVKAFLSLQGHSCVLQQNFLFVFIIVQESESDGRLFLFPI